MNQNVNTPVACYVKLDGDSHTVFTSPDSMCAVENTGETQHEIIVNGLISQVAAMPPSAAVTIHLCNIAVVNLVNGDWKIRERRLTPLVEQLRDLLDDRPRVKIAFMPKPELMANIRAIKAAIIKREADAEVDAEYLDYSGEDSVFPW